MIDRYRYESMLLNFYDSSYLSEQTKHKQINEQIIKQNKKQINKPLTNEQTDELKQTNK